LACGNEESAVKAVRVGLVGVGKIARDQHIPSLRASDAFELAACASRNAQVNGVPNFPTLDAMLASGIEIDAIAICSPPQVHYEAAHLALGRGKHVLMEKPPCPTVTQLSLLAGFAKKADRTLFQTWHSQYAAAVRAAERWLATRTIRRAHVTWKEDVRHWHPGQKWIWQAGGFGVFDPGINAISILTRILPQAIFVTDAALFVPSNCEAPIAADLTFVAEGGARITAAFDFRHTGIQTWDIDIETDKGALKLSSGGAELFIDGARVSVEGDDGEYPALYRRFAELVAQGTSDVDARPLQLVADAFLVGSRVAIEPFED
jgi:predicted dehydrogenase